MITRGTRTNYPLKLKLIENFLKSKFTFNRDPKGREYLQTPFFLVSKLLQDENISGDCDDSTCLILSMTKSIGFDGYMLFTSPNPQIPYTHVMALIVAGNIFYPMDITNLQSIPNFPDPIKLIKI